MFRIILYFIMLFKLAKVLFTLMFIDKLDQEQAKTAFPEHKVIGLFTEN